MEAAVLRFCAEGVLKGDVMQIQQTSIEAKQAVEPSAETLRVRVWSFIRDCGPMGATDEEIQLALRLGPQTQSPRRRELVQKGVVADSGDRRKTTRGRNAIVWVISTDNQGATDGTW